MKYLDEYRDPERIHKVLDALRARVTKPWTVMEVCGGQTHSILRFGLDQLLPADIELIHGPGCPVCVTATASIDQAIALAGTHGVTLCTFGDMLRVPGQQTDLLSAKAAGASVNIVYSPMDALTLAEQHPKQQIVLFAVGFETTAPSTAMAVAQANQRGLDNFSVILAHVRVPPALQAIMTAEDVHVQGFLAAGHVCTIMWTQEYDPIAAQYQIPIVVTGFEPLDLVQGLYRCIVQLESGSAQVENQYPRLVKAEGNPSARRLMDEIYAHTDCEWRGLGIIPAGGFAFKPAYRRFDAIARFGATASDVQVETVCQAGRVLRGALRPDHCPEFGRTCTPDTPLGAPMVSSEGACAAYFNYREIP